MPAACVIPCGAIKEKEKNGTSLNWATGTKSLGRSWPWPSREYGDRASHLAMQESLFASAFVIRALIEQHRAGSALCSGDARSRGQHVDDRVVIDHWCAPSQRIAHTKQRYCTAARSGCSPMQNGSHGPSNVHHATITVQTCSPFLLRELLDKLVVDSSNANHRTIFGQSASFLAPCALAFAVGGDIGKLRRVFSRVVVVPKTASGLSAWKSRLSLEDVVHTPYGQ